MAYYNTLGYKLENGQVVDRADPSGALGGRVTIIFVTRACRWGRSQSIL